MLIRRKRGWEIPESAATPEAVYFNRRNLMKGLAAGTILAPGLAAGLFGGTARAADEPDPSAGLYPFKRDPKYTLDRPLTPAKDVEHYNNFYEFTADKDVDASALPIRPWTIKIGGLVEKPFTIGIDDLMRKMPLEERLYRHRCVEAWSFTVPWSGFALSALVALAKPLSSAKYLKMVTFMNPTIAPEQNKFFYPWPYTEGLTMAEATNELPFVVTGMYGQPTPKQDGAPLRLAVPWKYGFKSIKSIVSFEFTDTQPATFWEGLQSSEYGFWANVNPAVPHPRWSQATERVIGTNERVPTLIYNGYGDYVASLYSGMSDQKLFM